MSDDSDTDSTPSTPAQMRRTKRIVAASLVGGPLLFFVIFHYVPAMMGFQQPALRLVEGCPRAVALLGERVGHSWYGFSYGNSESGGGTGHAAWTFPVRGSRGRGSLDVFAHSMGDVWTVDRARLSSHGTELDLLMCSVAAPLNIATQRYAATATQVVGSPGVLQGEPCAVTVAAGSGPYGCRVEVRCANRVLYGATPTTGFVQCAVDPQRGLVARDQGTTGVNGDPTLELAVGERRAVLTDQTPAGTWVVALQFAP